jgi:predicted heme/steroid binding protein
MSCATDSPAAYCSSPIVELPSAAPLAEAADRGSADSAPVDKCATLFCGDQRLDFNWSAETPAKAFGKQFRDAIRSLAGGTSLEGVELQKFDGLEKEPAQIPAVSSAPLVPTWSHAVSVTPRDIFEGRVSSVRVIVSTAGPSSAVASPVKQQPSRGEGKFQKKGGSQLEFMQMLSLNKNPVAPLSAGTRLTMEEVAKHNKRADCWTIFAGRVYDVTCYLPFHPGGKGELMKGAGKDCTEAFNESHSWVSLDGLIGRLCLGELVPSVFDNVEQSAKSTAG